MLYWKAGDLTDRIRLARPQRRNASKVGDAVRHSLPGYDLETNANPTNGYVYIITKPSFATPSRKFSGNLVGRPPASCQAQQIYSWPAPIPLAAVPALACDPAARIGDEHRGAA